jgi:hypothetical protein
MSSSRSEYHQGIMCPQSARLELNEFRRCPTHIQLESSWICLRSIVPPISSSRVDSVQRFVYVHIWIDWSLLQSRNVVSEFSSSRAECVRYNEFKISSSRADYDFRGIVCPHSDRLELNVCVGRWNHDHLEKCWKRLGVVGTSFSSRSSWTIWRYDVF